MKLEMMKKVSCLLILLAISVFVIQAKCPAADKEEKHINFNAAMTLADNLTAFKGKAVTVTLTSGQTVSGYVKEVTVNLLHLEKLSQKEFFDAIIVLDKITSVESRVR